MALTQTQGGKSIKNITMIEKHLYEVKNGKIRAIRAEYRIYKDLVYQIKTKSQLTKTEKEWLQKNGIAEVFHF